MPESGAGPLRTCVGCRRVRPKGELVRLARGTGGQVTLDDGNQLPGRGAYLCSGGVDCLAQARRRRALGRSLRVGDDCISYDELVTALAVTATEDRPSPR